RKRGHEALTRLELPVPAHLLVIAGKLVAVLAQRRRTLLLCIGRHFTLLARNGREVPRVVAMQTLEALVRLTLLAALPTILWAVSATAQRPPQENIDASKMLESGPLVMGGNGATAGPNSRNQAVSPMPGSTDEQLSERPAVIQVPLPPRSSTGNAPD